MFNDLFKNMYNAAIVEYYVYLFVWLHQNWVVAPIGAT